MTAVPISGGTRSPMGRKQGVRAAAEAGVTTTPRAILQFWLDFHPHSLVVPVPAFKISLHQLHFSPDTATLTILLPISLLFSLFFPFIFS